MTSRERRKRRCRNYVDGCVDIGGVGGRSDWSWMRKGISSGPLLQVSIFPIV
jgi:hypothetical protein